MLSAEVLNDLRKRVLNDESYTQAELTEAVRQMIADRVNAFAEPKAKGSSKTKSTPVSLDDLI